MTRIAVILPGLGRVQRGAETAFWQIAARLAQHPDLHVEAFGSGHSGPEGVIFHRVPCISRKWFRRWPRMPCLRNECYYEELTFVLGMIASGRYRSKRFDVAIACTYPYVNWLLQRHRRKGGPLQLFVTQNGDWMCRASSREYRYFGCDGLVCINPEYHRRHKDRYSAKLIPNGVDPQEFYPALSFRAERSEQIQQLAAVPPGRPVVLMVSALIESKRVAEGIRAVAKVPEAFLVVAGDGPQQRAVSQLAAELLPRRHLLLGSLPVEQMPGVFRRADAFLHMSLIEPFGIVYLEAAASGLPIVAPDLEVPRWILGNAALFADPQDLHSLADALGAAILPETKCTLGRAARRRVLSDWTWDVQGDKYRDFILELIDARAGIAPQKGTDRDLDHHHQFQHT